jgi:preprotein translocase subunit SecG
MMLLPILAVGFIMKIAAVLFVLCSVVLILVILIQKGRGGGLSAAFGGGMASGLLGSKTGDFLTWVTIILVAIFLTFAVLLAKYYKPTITEYGSAESISQQMPVDAEPSAEVEYEDTIVEDVNVREDMNVPGS